MVAFEKNSLIPPLIETHPKGIIKRWSYPLGLFSFALQQLPHLENKEKRAELAWEIDRYWLARRSPNSLKTLRGLSTTLSSLSPMFPALRQQGETVIGKQQPSILESVDETIKRLQFLQRYTRALPENIVSCISGGSMSYGRFYNVRGGEDSSDLDLILVYDHKQRERLTASAILPDGLGFDPEDKRILEERIRVFFELLDTKQAQVLSQKSFVAKEGFWVSMHIMGRDVFNETVVYNPARDVKQGSDTDARVLDYKPAPFKHQYMRQRDFQGEEHVFSADETPVVQGVRTQEVISRIPSHAIVRGNYVPGMYQNLLSPRFEAEPFTSHTVLAAVTMYWGLMTDLAQEAKKQNNDASILQSHIRYPIFSPKLIEYYDKAAK